MTEQEINDRIREFNNIDIERRNEINRLSRQRMGIQQEKLRSLIGHCYKDKYDRKIFIITDVPQPEYMKIGDFHFNPYQLPAKILMIEDGINHYFKTKKACEIIDDTIFSRAVETDDPVAHMAKEYEELSIEDFRIIAYNIIDRMIESCTTQEKN